VNSRDNNFTQGKIKRRQKQIEESVARYMIRGRRAGPAALQAKPGDWQ
jgi:hypothetical protein